MWMVIDEDNGTGTHFPLWDAEVLCQAPEVLCQVGDMDDGGQRQWSTKMIHKYSNNL